MSSRSHQQKTRFSTIYVCKLTKSIKKKQWQASIQKFKCLNVEENLWICLKLFLNDVNEAKGALTLCGDLKWVINGSHQATPLNFF